MGDTAGLFHGQKTRGFILFTTITLLYTGVLKVGAQTIRFSTHNNSKELISCFEKKTINDSVQWYTSYNTMSGNAYQMVETKKYIDSRHSKVEQSINSIYVRENNEDVNVQMKAIYEASPYRNELEKWVYFYKNDTLSKIELYEEGKYNQQRKIKFCKNTCEINYYRVDSIGNIGPSYAKDSMVISDGGSTLDSHYLRWGETYKTRSEMTNRQRKLWYDDTSFRRETYHYNNWTINEHILSIMAGEGPIVIFPEVVMNFEKQLIKKRKTKEGKEVSRSAIKVEGGKKIYRIKEQYSAGEKYTTEVVYLE